MNCKYLPYRNINKNKEEGHIYKIEGEKMGWSNYIIVDSLKIVVETNREVQDIEMYREDALNKIIDIEEDTYIDDNIFDINNIKISELSIGHLSILCNAFEDMSNIYGMHIDKFLLFWLKKKDIKFEVESENSVNVQEYIDNGYIVLRRV